ncbi:prephenate dehydratase domain-containing protein, partial [Acinetobacter baumannii]
KSKHIAAVAGKLAAELFNLEIAAPNIHTQKNNYTRFLILKRKDEEVIANDANKASINFQTNHTKGSLAKVLTKIAEA